MARVSRVVEGGGKMVDSNGEVSFLCCGIRAHEARKGFNGGTCNMSPKPVNLVDQIGKYTF